MLQKTPDDADDADAFRHSGYTGTQTAGITHDQVNRNSGLRRLVERLDDISIFKGVYLELDQASATFTVQCGLAFNLCYQRLLEKTGGSQQKAVFPARFESRSQVIEQFSDVIAQCFAAAQQADIAIGAGCVGVIIAGADMNIPT